MKIGVCDASFANSQKTVALLEMQIQNTNIGRENVEIVSYNPDSVTLDLDEGRFDCDVFITEIVFANKQIGVELAKLVNMASPSCKVIFYADYVPDDVDVYEASHVCCVLKHKHDNRLIKYYMDLINEKINEDRKCYIKIRYDRTVNVLDCRNIQFIRIENRVTKFYTKDGIFYEYKPLSEIVEELPDNFVRCHAAAIVNMDYVKNYNHSMITMQGGEQIRIGRTYSDSFK